ncbi:MAG: PAS domain S-box protein, partial [Bacteroidales bacterium]|nr:PAS domain S-box protein [Bacteroidales bacterium]
MRDQKGPVKILVIDDHPDQARLIKVILEKDDCLIFEANNGISGIELARSIHPDLILLDIMMPVMDGFEVCRHLKDDPLTGEALVVLVSALKTEQADQYNGLENNADGFITLPLSNKELREHILAYLQIILSERHFHQNQPYFEDIFETMGDGIGYTTLTGKIIAVNRALESMTGINRKELVGKSIIPITSRVLSGNQKKNIIPLLSDIIKGKEIRPFYVEINNRVLEVNSKYNRATKRLIGVFRDITELKAANEAVRASENRLRNLYDNMAEGVCLHKMVYNEHGTPVNYRIVGINRRYESIIKLNNEEVLGKLATEVYKTDTPPYLEMYSSVVRTQVSQQFETYYPPMERYFSISVSPWESDGFATLFSDITERKKIEKELILNEERTRILLDLAPEAFFQGDNSGNFILVNDKASELTGYSKEELYQMNMKDLFDPGQLAEKPLQYQQLSQSETLQVEREIVRKDGSLLPVEMSSRAMPDSTYQSFFRNIQERKAAELTIRESEEKFRTLAECSPNAIMIYQD